MNRLRIVSGVLGQIALVSYLMILAVSTSLLAQDCPHLELEWARFWGQNRTDLGNAIFVADDDIYIAGTSKTPGPDYTFLRALLLKYDSDGNLIWERMMGYSTPMD